MLLHKYKIENIAEIISGATPLTSDLENYDGEIVWFTPKDLSNQNKKIVERGERCITKKGFDTCSAQMIPAYNVLMSSRAPIGLLAINRFECCTNQGFKSLVLDKSLCDENYIYYYLKYHLKEIEALGSGTTFKEISKDALKHFELSIPDILVQKRLSHILNIIDDKIELNRQINQNLPKPDHSLKVEEVRHAA